MGYQPIVKSWKIMYDKNFGDPVKEGNEAMRRLVDLFVKGMRYIPLRGFYCRLCGESASLESIFPTEVVTDFIVSIERINGVEVPIENLCKKNNNEFIFEEESGKVSTTPIYLVKTTDEKTYYITTSDINYVMVNALAVAADIYC